MWKIIVVVVTLGLRWLLHVPSGMVSGQSWQYDWLIDLGQVYDEIPQAKGLPDGIVLAGTAGTIMVWWNFANAAIGAFTGFLGPLPLCIGLVDLGISLTLIIGLSKQGTFLPASYAGCNRIIDENNFFQIASDTYHGLKTPQALCRALVWNRSFSIAVVSLYLITTTGNLLLGGVGLVECIHSGILSRICPSWVLNTAKYCKSKAIGITVGGYAATGRAGIRIREIISTASFSNVRAWWMGRKSGHDGKLYDEAENEEAIGLMPHRDDQDDFELEGGEAHGLTVNSQKPQDDESKAFTGSSRWSGETVAGGHADAHP
ncbi:hypothetical protein B0J13DRAFT_674230 [Dactylonectria estremocensis]|uniref:Uncharacterized protein n=1 Tax=Dactylonectria estremocensis TaxID=1079267 RepID=A0A9P9F0L5_9HYPO|nr:hypothetical protein B0J13DRAFT_674230 [Dactylonectria estremocensis]